MSADRLLCLLAGTLAGEVNRTAGGQLQFVYDETWRNKPSSYALSTSMPLVQRAHPHGTIEPFLQGLLPDDPAVLERWGKRFHVSPHVPFALIAEVGEDCPGAVQFVRPERLEELQRAGTSPTCWLDEGEIEARLEKLVTERTAWLPSHAEGRFSLAGAQSKFAVSIEDSRWGLPSGRAPTTHIVKPPIAGLDGHVENEHLCLTLARELGIPAASSAVRTFGRQTCIVVTRYDRLSVLDERDRATHRAQELLDASPIDTEEAAQVIEQAQRLTELAEATPIQRIHQEDICQALSLYPRNKYQSDGGPNPQQIVELLRRVSAAPSEDETHFIDALLLNWVIAGSDAHAKNYSLLITAGNHIRLAPLYDLASALPYSEPHPRQVKLAMKVGTKYRVQDIWRPQWQALAEQVGWKWERLELRLTNLLGSLPSALDRSLEQCADLQHPILEQLDAKIRTRIESCAQVLQ